MSVISTGTSNGLYVKDLDDVLGIGATINAAGQFVAAIGPEIRRVTASPNGTISDFGGSLALDVTNGAVYVNTSKANAVGTNWSVMSTGLASSGVSRVLAIIATLAAQGATTGTATPVAVQFVIPANTLSGGSTLQVRMAGNMNQAGVGTLTVAMALGATTLISVPAIGFANATALVLDFNSTIRGASATATAASSVSGESSTSSFSSQLVSAATINTTIANTLTLTLTFSAAAAGTSMDINEYELYISV